MKIEGVDRVVVAVKDLDKAAAFFSRLLGISFEEVTGPMVESGGVRFGVGALPPQQFPLRIELIQPVHPLKDVRPPDPKAIAKRVEHVDAAVHALVFKVKDTAEAAEDAKKAGVRIYDTIEIKKIPSWGITDFRELFAEEEDTLGVNMAFVEFKKDSPVKDG
jgi:catechol 2,3-dioxygenase-like lactoylglutathione lyase family enzyme